MATEPLKIRLMLQNGKVQEHTHATEWAARTELALLRKDMDCVAAQLLDSAGTLIDGYNMPFVISEDNPTRTLFEHTKKSLIGRIQELESLQCLRALEQHLNELTLEDTCTRKTRI